MVPPDTPGTISAPPMAKPLRNNKMDSRIFIGNKLNSQDYNLTINYQFSKNG